MLGGNAAGSVLSFRTLTSCRCFPVALSSSLSCGAYVYDSS